MEKIIALIAAIFGLTFGGPTPTPGATTAPLPTLTPSPTPLPIIYKIIGSTESAKFLLPNDEVSTSAKMTGEIDFSNGTIARLAPMTNIKITSNKLIKHNLGKLYIRFKRLVGVNEEFSVQTPTALATVRGSAFASILPNIFYVTDHEIEIIEGTNSAKILTASQSAKIKLPPDQKSWIDFNLITDGVITPTPTLKPTPTKAPVPFISAPSGTGVTYGKVHTDKGDFTATVMSIDLSTTRVITDTANDSDCGNDCPVTSLQDFVNKNGGFAGVSGTYQCPASYPDCANKKNSFDLPVYNSRLSKWINGGNLSWGERRAIFYVDGSGAHYQNSSQGFGGGVNAALVNFPGLLDNGNVQIDDNQSGLASKQSARGLKLGIGVKDNNHIMVVAGYSVNLLEFAHIFKSLGAKGALNLDPGGSTAIYFNGRYVLGPGRAIPNAIIFVRK